jgi:hypothetical protein
MEWVQFVIFFIGVFGLFVWNRTESRTDNRHMDTKLDGQRNLMNAIMEQNQMIQKEITDFHYRLLEIERSRKS